MNEVITSQAHASAGLVGVSSTTESMTAPRACFTVECLDSTGKQLWTDVSYNLVTTGGKNDLLDKYLAGSAYTAAWFCGLVSSVTYTAIAAADTMASHTGWTEAGATNAPTYSAGTRVALTFAAAAGASKATSAASSFTFNGAGTIKGMFASSVSTKDGTTGILYNAVLFSGGDRIVASGDVVNVSVTYSA